MALRNYIRITSYNEAMRLYNQGVKKLAHNTYLVDNGEYLAVKYHNTEIVKYFESGIISLFTGGWYSATTKERLHLFTPDGVRVYQKAGIWYVERNGYTNEDHNDTREFYEGIRI